MAATVPGFPSRSGHVGVCGYWYVVEVDYASPPPVAWFGNKIPATHLANFACGIKCVLQEHDGTTQNPIGNEVTTTVTNAITGQG